MKFKNHLESIKATLVNYPSVEELESYIPEFCAITWMEGKEDTDSFLESRKMTRNDMVMEMFNYRTLPTALETVRLTFFLEGLDLTNVTHIIRHRMFSFSAQSTDPVSMENHDILTNDAFDYYPDLSNRAKKLCEESNQLYKDALDRGISYYDARHYQPRAKESKYFMSGNIKEFIMFIRTRLGRMNQPTSDNILAMKIRKEILKVYPFLKIPLEEVQHHYVNAINEKMNLNTFPPDSLHKTELKNKNINYSKAKFSHKTSRDSLPYIHHFNKIFDESK